MCFILANTDPSTLYCCGTVIENRCNIQDELEKKVLQKNDFISNENK